MSYITRRFSLTIVIPLFLSLVLLRAPFVCGQIDFDQIPPYVVQVNPSNNQMDVPVTSSILVEFNETMDTFLSGNPLNITPEIAGNLFWDQGLFLIFQPYTSLSFGTGYQVTVDTTAVDFYGNPLPSPYQWSFVTESFPWLHYDSIQGIDLSQAAVQAILGADNGDVWIALSTGDLFRFDGTQFHSIMHSFGHINGMVQDSKDRIWVAAEPDEGSGTGGIHVYNAGTWLHYTSQNSPLTNDAVTCIAVDAQDVIWAGSSSSGIHRFDGQSWTTYTTLNSGLSDNWITTVLAEGSNRVWIGTTFGGIQSLDTTSWIWNSLTPDIELQSGVSFPPTSAMASHSGRIWLATNAGLIMYESGNDAWSLFDRQGDFLPDDYCTSLLWHTQQDRLFVGTLGGVAIVDGEDWNVIPMGGRGPDVWTMAMDHFGRVWMGTGNSLSIYDSMPPSLLNASPSDNQKDVPRDSTIVLVFSEPMDPDSVVNAVGISPQAAVSSSWDAHRTKLVLTPHSSLSYDTLYRVTVTTGAKDRTGHPLRYDYAWSFRTKKKPSSSASGSSKPGFTYGATLYGGLSSFNLGGFYTRLSPNLSYGSLGQSSLLSRGLLQSYRGSTFSAYPSFGTSLLTRSFAGAYPYGGIGGFTSSYRSFIQNPGLSTLQRGISMTYQSGLSRYPFRY